MARNRPSSAEPPHRDTNLEGTIELLERARQGDRQAVEQLFERHLAPLQRFARGRLPAWARDLADTDDLVQDTLLRTFKRIEDIEPRRSGSLHAYLREAVLNRLRDELRRKSRAPHQTDVADLDLTAGASPLELAIGQEAIDAYELALARLKTEEREAVIGRVEMGFSYQELALALGKPTPEAARKAAQRAIIRLAEEMQRGR